MEYELYNDIILIRAKGEVPAGPKVLKGVVKDKSGAVLPGVTVVIKGTTFRRIDRHRWKIFDHHSGGWERNGIDVYICRHEATGGQICRARNVECDIDRGSGGNGRGGGQWLLLPGRRRAFTGVSKTFSGDELKTISTEIS